MQKMIVGMVCVLALLSLNAIATTQSRAKKNTSTDNRKQVTITLVRWPYT
jgi:hypothetical protein